jgi:hypothetical protein
LQKLKTLPANAISGRLGGGNDDETFAAAKNSNLFLKTCLRLLEQKIITVFIMNQNHYSKCTNNCFKCNKRRHTFSSMFSLSELLEKGILSNGAGSSIL